MRQSGERIRSNFASPSIVMVGVTSTVFLIGFSTDLFEKIWKLTRGLETWQLDELVIASVAAVVSGLIIALRRISALEEQIAELQKKEKAAPPPVTQTNDHVDCVIRCVGCGKFQIYGDQWFSREEFAALTQRPDVLAGVCPGYQPAPDEQGGLA